MLSLALNIKNSWRDFAEVELFRDFADVKVPTLDMDGIHGTSREEHHSSWALSIKLASLVTSFYGDVWKWETPHYHPVYFMFFFF